MKRTLGILCVLASCLVFAAESPWQYGRIVKISKSVNTRTKVWVVNTPINEDEISYTISVHVGDKILLGIYELTTEELPPPEEWTANYPVRVQVVGDRLYLRAPTGDLRLHIAQRKASRPMAPLTADEKKQLEQVQSPSHPLTGFSEESSSKPGSASSSSSQPAPVPPPPAQPVNAGTVSVRSTPYLSEVFVDGDSMGYTPAKINLPPGKHAFRVEKSGYKPWAKEMTITVGSELTLDANLEKK